jgi:hypothetical protein
VTLEAGSYGSSGPNYRIRSAGSSKFDADGVAMFGW